MKVEISKTANEYKYGSLRVYDTYDVRYSSSNGKGHQSGYLGSIHLVDNMYVFMLNGLPNNVMSKINDMDKIIYEMYKVKPTYVNTLF